MAKATNKRHKSVEVLVPTKFGRFLCIFQSNEPDKGFTVTSPAALGFVTYGKTMQEAKKMAKAGLAFHYECEFLEHIRTPRHTQQRVSR